MATTQYYIQLKGYVGGAEIKTQTQFLEGRSKQNFDKTSDKVHINELCRS